MIDDRLDSGGLLAQKLAGYRERGVSRVKLGLTDLDGVIRGKYVNLDKFTGLMERGGGFCDCVFGWDTDDALYDDARHTGWHTGFPDARYRLLVDTERWLADEGCPYFIGEFTGADGGPHPLCPRTLLNRVLGRLAEHGLYLRSGFEYEFFVFEETPHSVRDKGYRNLKPLTPGNFGYSVLRASAQSDLFTGLMDYCGSLDLDLEGLHCETGPGVWEAALKARDGIEAADRANLFKTFAKAFFQKRGLVATFMAKWSMDYPGQSGHFHFCLIGGDSLLGGDTPTGGAGPTGGDGGSAGGNRFFDPDDANGMSALQRYAVAGLQRYLGDYLAMMAPTVNSYTRLVQGAWAPTAATWGLDNRTAALRVIGGGGSSQRIECRVPGADANPYLAAAGTIAAVLQGIEEGLQPDAPVAGNAYEAEDAMPADDKRRFPGQLRAAADRLLASAGARGILGDEFVEHFGMSRHWESREYERHVNSWQLERYFEII
ncbi:MAG: glutamine synthetase family protein [Gammaproteobacteria bacterium]|nr:glutamine synthetase family protein [Gammaproteobacteria bacterium]